MSNEYDDLVMSPREGMGVLSEPYWELLSLGLGSWKPWRMLISVPFILFQN